MVTTKIAYGKIYKLRIEECDKLIEIFEIDLEDPTILSLLKKGADQLSIKRAALAYNLSQDAHILKIIKNKINIYPRKIGSPNIIWDIEELKEARNKTLKELEKKEAQQQKEDAPIIDELRLKAIYGDKDAKATLLRRGININNLEISDIESTEEEDSQNQEKTGENFVDAQIDNKGLKINPSIHPNGGTVLLRKSNSFINNKSKLEIVAHDIMQKEQVDALIKAIEGSQDKKLPCPTFEGRDNEDII